MGGININLLSGSIKKKAGESLQTAAQTSALGGHVLETLNWAVLKKHYIMLLLKMQNGMMIM